MKKVSFWLIFLNAPWHVPLEDLAGISWVRGVVTCLRVTGR